MAMPVGRLKNPSPPFRLPNAPWYLPFASKQKYLAGLRVGDVDVVFAVDGHALRLDHRVLALFLTIEEFVLVLAGIEDVNAAGSGIGNDDPSVRIYGNAVRPRQRAIVGLPATRLTTFPQNPGWFFTSCSDIKVC